MMVASEVWVQAVTDAALTEGIVWGIVLSSLFAMVSVFVFTGSVIVMALAAATMVCINTLILGLYHVMGWRLGAIEGVSITVLVGLSVDFAIHFSEAFVRSRLIGRRERAQSASPPSPLFPLPPFPCNPRPLVVHTSSLRLSHHLPSTSAASTRYATAPPNVCHSGNACAACMLYPHRSVLATRSPQLTGQAH